ncbi:hypothetical protein [Lyngbya aestuarii]|uniref:hypothetical protein n=1 Tax=Lyngbya aestuarii TaxID=118322 RepID=UPI00403E3571
MKLRVLLGLTVSLAIFGAGFLPACAQSPSSEIAQLTDVSYEICGESNTWRRPTETEQIRELQTIPRYGADLTREPLKSTLQTFRGQNIFSFTSYGLSSRIEPIYFSGLWTIEDTLFGCYDSSSRVAQINTGEIAEVWLILHRVVNLKWLDNHYVLVVEPTQQGVQFIQFSRKENQPLLPLEVVTENGRELEVIDAG